MKFTREWLDTNLCGENGNIIEDEKYLKWDDIAQESLYEVIFKYENKFYSIYLWSFWDAYLNSFDEYNSISIRKSDIECPEVEYKEITIKKWVEINEYEG